MAAPSHCLIPGSTLTSEISERFVGAKARNLVRLASASFAVPEFWVVPTTVYETAMRPHRSAVLALARDLADLDAPALEARAKSLRDDILTAGDSTLTLDALRCSLRDGEGATYAVRSSVIGEDGAVHSFAGVMDSFLDQHADRAPEAIRRVWASTFSLQALLYCQAKNIPIADISVAVIVQRMVDADASGVVFTRDPVSGARACVVAAVAGAGFGILAEQQTCERYVLEPIACGDAHTQACGVGRGRPREGSALCSDGGLLSPDELETLRALASRVEGLFGRPQDIEWARDGAGRFWLLQARPITASAKEGKSLIWDNANIVESFPGTTLPLTFSFARVLYEHTFRGVRRRFFPLQRRRAKRLPVLYELLGLVDGRVYLNLLSWYEMLAHLPGFARHKRAWNVMFGITEEVAVPRHWLSWLDDALALSAMLISLATVRLTGRRFASWFEALYSRYSRTDLASADAFELVALWEALVQDLAERWHLTIINDFCAMSYVEALEELRRRFHPGARVGPAAALLRAGDNLASIAPYRSLLDLARLFRATPGARDLLAEADDRVVLQRLRSDRRFASLWPAIERHIAAFGDRAFEDLKLESVTLRECPEQLIPLLRARIGHDSALDPPANAPADVPAATGQPLRRWLLRLIAGRARAAIRNREYMRLARSRTYGLVRSIVRRLGGLLAERGVIESPADIHFLTMSEACDVVRGASATRELAAIVALRKAEYARFSRRAPRDRFRTTGIPDFCTASEVDPADTSSTLAVGTGCSTGAVEGTARIVRDPRSVAVGPEDIIVARSTDPGWLFLLTRCRGLVVEKGSPLSHTAIIGRELGVPTVVGVAGATDRIPDGAWIRVDATSGVVQWQ